MTTELAGKIGLVWQVSGWILVGLFVGASVWLFLNAAIPVPGPEGFLFWFWHANW